MSDPENELDRKPPERILPKEEEEALRKQVRARLSNEYEKTHGQTHKRPDEKSVAEQLQAERLRIVREEEDAFYAERGLYRYRNHRGEYEWLTAEERDARIAARGSKKSRRSRPSLWSSLSIGKLSGEVINVLIVVAVLAIAVVVLRSERKEATRFAVDVRSEPAGAAIFINGEPANAATNARVSLKEAGMYTVHIARPGYRTVPPSIEVHVSNENPSPIVLFSLYPAARDSGSL